MLWTAAVSAIASMGKTIGYALMATGGATVIWMPLSFFKQLNNKRFFAVILCGVALLMAAYALLSDSTPTIAAADSVLAPSAPSAAAPAPHPAPQGSISPDPNAKPAPKASGAPAPATRPSSPAHKSDLAARYTDNANGYCICFPAGWTSQQFDSGDPWFIDVSDGKSAMISVGFSPFPSSAGVEQLKPANLASRIKSRPKTTLLSQGSSKVGGKPALWFKYNGPVETSSGPRTMTCVHYFVPLGDGRLMELRLAAAPEAFPRTAPLLRKSAATLKLFPL